MGKVVWHVTMLLDGFIAGPNDSMDWVFFYVERVEGMKDLLRADANTANPSDSLAMRSIEETIRSHWFRVERSAKLQRGQEAGAASRGAQGAPRRLERSGVRAHAPAT